MGAVNVEINEVVTQNIEGETIGDGTNMNTNRTLRNMT